MNLIKDFQINLDLIQTIKNPTIQLKETDLNSVYFTFAITDDGVPVDLTDCTVRLVVKKPSGLTVFQDCDLVGIQQGLCAVYLTNQAFIEAGNHTAELIITKSIENIIVVTNSFEFTSLNAIMDDETLQSSDDWQTLHDILLNQELRPILGEGSPNGIHTPEYRGQSYLDTIGMVMFFASTTTNDGWLPFSSGTGGTGGPIYWNDVLLKPSTFTPSTHTHVWTDITDAPTQMAPTAHTHDWGTGITNKPLAFTPEAHTHNWADIVDPPSDLGGASSWNEITDKPLTFPPDTHTHDFGAITGKPLTYPAEAHNHAITDVTGLTEALGTKLEAIPAEYLTQTEGDARYEPIGGGGGSVAWVDITGKPLEFNPEAHTHTTAEITGLDTTLAGKADAANVYTKAETYNKTEIDQMTMGEGGASPVIVEDNLASISTTNALSANQGRILDTTKADIAHSHSYADITDKPLTFTPETHTHAVGEVTGLQLALDGKADDAHTHTTADVTGLDTALTGKADAVHVHTTTDITGLDTTLAGKADLAHTHDWDTGITGKPLAFTPEAHTHTTTDVTGLDTALAGKADDVHAHAIGDVTGLQLALDGKADDAHTHTTTDITGLDTALAGKSNTGHTHTTTEITGLDTTLAGKSDVGHTHTTAQVTGLDTALAGKSDTTHTHDDKYLQLTGGTVTNLALSNKGDNAEQLRFDIDRAWSFKQIGLDATAQLGLVADTNNKTFNVMSPLGTKTLEVRVSDTPETGYVNAPVIQEGGVPLTEKYALKGEVGSVDTSTLQDRATPTVGIPTSVPKYLGEIAVEAGTGNTGKTYIANGTTADTWERLADTAYVDVSCNLIANTQLAGLNLWKGTQTDYDNVLTKDPNTLYFIANAP